MGMLDGILANPFVYWSHIVGLFMATVWILVACIFLISVTIKGLRTVTMRNTYQKFAHLLYQVAVKNEEMNPPLADLAKMLLVEMDPSTVMAQGLDMVALRKRLGVPSVQDLQAEAKANDANSQ